MSDESKTVKRIYSEYEQPQIEHGAGKHSEKYSLSRVRLHGFPREKLTNR